MGGFASFIVIQMLDDFYSRNSEFYRTNHEHKMKCITIYNYRVNKRQLFFINSKLSLAVILFMVIVQPLLKNNNYSPQRRKARKVKIIFLLSAYIAKGKRIILPKFPQNIAIIKEWIVSICRLLKDR